MKNRLGSHLQRRLLAKSNFYRNQWLAQALEDRVWVHPWRQKQQQFHATAKREILPFVAAATVLVVGRYSWKALQRMDEEWDDYQWELRQYEKQQMKAGDESVECRTIAIDVGTSFTKIATSYPKSSIVISREGDRALFNGVKIDGESVTRGPKAMEGFFFDSDLDENCPVLRPLQEIEKDHGKGVLDASLSPALSEALDSLGYDSEDQATIFRSVVSVPSDHLNSNAFKAAFLDVSPTFVPDAVSAVWGAQVLNLIPDLEKDQIALVVDVGGMTTQLSAIQCDKLVHSVSVPWGAERWIEIIVNTLRRGNEDSIPVNDTRSLAALQVQARAALLELSTKTRVDIHVPYVFSDTNNHHLDASLSRSLFEQSIDKDIQLRLVREIPALLSPHLPSPKSTADLFSSLLTHVLEESQLTPLQIDHLVLVGGGSRAPMVKKAVENSLLALTGSSTKLAAIDNSIKQDVVSIGASSMLSNYCYSIEDGLVRL